MNETKPTTCTVLKDVMVDVKVEATFNNSGQVRAAYRSRDMRELYQALMSCVHEFEAFLRDHRSQDWIQLSVVPVNEALCSACKHEWESYDEDGHTFCSYCGAMLETTGEPK